MEKYTKIDGIYIRDNVTKKVIIGKYTDKTIEYLNDIEWIGTEKIDGMNIRVCWDGYDIEFRGRTDRAVIPIKLLEHLKKTFDCHELFEQKFGEKEVILFGEGYGAKINGNHLDEKDNKFILFDVMVNGHYLDFEDMCDIADYFGIPHVYAYCKYTSLYELMLMVKRGNLRSLVNPDRLAEGIVARPLHELQDGYGNRIITKLKRKDLYQEDKE